MADNSLGAKVGVPVVLPTVGPWVSFSPTLTGSSSAGTITYATQAGRYRQNGDSVQVQLGIAVNTVTAAPTGFLALVPPPGLTPDGTVSLYLGGGFFGDSSAGTNNPVRVEYAAGVLAILNDSSTPIPVLGAGDVIRLEYMVPVTQYALTAYTAYGAGLATSVKSGLVGGSNGSAIAAGMLGETQLISTSSASFGSTTVYQNIQTWTATLPGRYSLTSMTVVNNAASHSGHTAVISKNSGNTTTDHVFGVNALTASYPANSSGSVTIANYIVDVLPADISGGTNIFYQKGIATGATTTGFASLRAQRIG